MKNNRGSIAIALVIAVASILSIIFLTSLLLTETTANKKYDKRIEKQVYLTNNVMETIINVFQQKLTTLDIPFQEGTFYAITSADLENVEKVINEEVFPFLFDGITVDFSNLRNSLSLDMLCEESMDYNTYTTEPEVVGTDCNQTFFSISFDIELSAQSGKQNFTISFADVFPNESPAGNIQIVLTNLEVNISS